MKKIFISMIFMVFGCLTLMAQIRQVTVEVEGLACPFCAVRLEENFIKIESARNVKIDLKKSLLTFEMPASKELSETNIKKKVKKAGFTAGKVTFGAVKEKKGKNGKQ